MALGPRRRFRLWRVAVRAAAVVAIVLAATGCSDCTWFGDDSSPGDSGPWPLTSPLARHVPDEASGVVFVRRLGALRRAIEYAEGRFAAANRGTASTLESIRRNFRPAKFGLEPQSGLVAFLRKGHAGIAAEVASRKQFDAAIRSLDDQEIVAVQSLPDSEIRQFSLPDSSETVVQFALRSGHLLARTAPATPPSGPSGPADVPAKFDAFFADHSPTEGRSGWPRSSSERRLLRGVVGGEGRSRAVGWIAPGPWLRRIASSGQAAIIQSRLSQQLGPTAFRIGFDSSRRELDVELRNRSVSGEPTVVADMGRASGDLPSLGGLVEPGVLGVLRLSVEPEAVYRLLESTLPAARREQVDVFWRHVEQKLLIDGPEEVLDNLTGHAVVVFYGLEGDQISGSGIEILRSFFELRATREAILLPIKSRKKAERLLDKMTQITKGRLSRQRGEHTVQYAWFDEGVLRWALILSDEHVLFVDSATSLEKAMRYERKGRPLSRSRRREMRIAPLLEGRQRSGLYLEAGMVAEMLRQQGFGRAADLLGSFRSAVVTTERSGEVSSTRIRLHLVEL